MSDPVLLGLCGSLRQGASNRKLLLEAVRLFGPCRFSEADLRMPLYDGDDEETIGIPAPAKTLAHQIAAADAIIVTTPEYNSGPSGALKNALDWASRVDGSPWAGKPVAIMSAAAGRTGGVMSQNTLRGFLVPFRPRLITGPQVSVAACYEAFDEAGRLKGELYVKTLTELMSALRAEIDR